MLAYDPNIGWEYELHPNEPQVGARCVFLLTILQKHPQRFDRYGVKTEPGHSFVFNPVTPLGCDYFAGNFRGSNFPILQDYRVIIQNDPKVGTLPGKVKKEMHEFDMLLTRALAAFDKAIPMAAAAGKSDLLLAKFVAILANFLTKFLTIHPYANGNGHMGRLLVWVLLGRYSYWPVAWPLDASPSYGDLLAKHRRGDPVPLVNFLLSCIIGKPPLPATGTIASLRPANAVIPP